MICDTASFHSIHPGLSYLKFHFQAALSNTAIPKVNVASTDTSNEQPEVDVSDEEFLQFDTSGVPVIITLTKARQSYT